MTHRTRARLLRLSSKKEHLLHKLKKFKSFILQKTCDIIFAVKFKKRLPLYF